MAYTIGVITSVEDDDYQGKSFKKVTLGTGEVLKVKYGNGGALKAKWGLLQEGVAIKFTMGDFNGKPFVQDIETVEGELPPSVKVETAKVPAEPPTNGKPDNGMSKGDWANKDTRTRHSIEGQKAADLTTQLWVADKIKDNDIRVESLLSWLLIALTKNMPDKVEVVVDIKPFGGEDIKALLNNAGVTQKQASEILTEKYKITKQASVMKMIEGLDKVQLKWFMDDITKRLDPEEAEVDIPF
ncbi:hypothetical protein LCGC14_1251510 [marine sediment metagenome]|uniref:Uncharacterized protein n=1 Tax=marine sediment metagenome TaxID=412755 RepID=A0A0F9NK33_9ZZZZ